MQRRDFLLSGAALGTGALLPAAIATAQTPPLTHQTTLPFVKGGVYQAGSQAQLFVDQMVVRSTDGISFTLHQGRKHPANPLVKVDQPWEGWAVELFGNVFFDEEEQVFKMWYTCESPEYFPRYAAHYATSRDGIHWEKPLVGTIESRIPCQHNAVAEGCEVPNVFQDLNDPDPSRRYKMIATVIEKDNQPRYHTLISTDGLHWTQYSEKPICAWMDVISGFYDRQRNLWVALAKDHTAVIPNMANVRRAFYLITSSDFKTWSQPQLAIYPDMKDDAGTIARIERVRAKLDVPDDPDLVRTEFYGVGFYQAESCVVGFPWVFSINNTSRYKVNDEGPCELQLAVSRDLRNWERPFRVPCVAMGLSEEWDSGFFITASEALRVKDEIWLYYSASNHTHGNPCNFNGNDTGRKTKFTYSIGLAAWPLDRFVSVDGLSEGGTLTTVPLAFTGNRLELNLNTKLAGKSGSARVELLSAAGEPLEGFGLSDAIEGDSLRHTVTWSGMHDVSRLQQKSISLQFHLQNTELYSFAFRE